MNINILSKLKSAKLRTMKAKMIVEAMEKGHVVRGNHTIKSAKMKADSYIITMFYRNTTIISVFIVDNELNIVSVDAGKYENTPATIRQRQDFTAAIAEIRKVVEA